jgi:hypothetical protein
VVEDFGVAMPGNPFISSWPCRRIRLESEGLFTVGARDCLIEYVRCIVADGIGS